MPGPGVRKALDVLKIFHQVERTPGFGATLGFSFVHLRPQDVSCEDGNKSLTVRMPLTDSLLWKNSNVTVTKGKDEPAAVGMLSTFAAIIDESTTVALVTAGARPGVSVVLSMEAVSESALYDLRAGDTVEIASTVLRSGRNLGFTKAEIRLASTGQVLCTGSHVKFLNNLPFWGNFLFSSWGWPLFKAACDCFLKAPSSTTATTTKTLVEHFATLESDDGGKTANFSGSPALASLGGPIHGGAQAILLERAAETALSLLSDWKLDSMQVEYQSAPNLQPKIKIATLVEERNKIVIRSELWSRGKLNSTGIFRYSLKQK